MKQCQLYLAAIAKTEAEQLKADAIAVRVGHHAESDAWQDFMGH